VKAPRGTSSSGPLALIGTTWPCPPSSGSSREPPPPRTPWALMAFGRGTATADGYRRRRAWRGRESRRRQGFLYRVRIPSRPSCASLTPSSPVLYFLFSSTFSVVRTS